MDESVRMRVAVDAMGGDFAPTEVVRGAMEAVRRGGVEVILVGPEAQLAAELAACQASGWPVRIHHTDQFVLDGESAAAALRAKPRASVIMAARLAKEGGADAAVSLGHTGACMIAAHWTFGPLPGVRRPIGAAIPFSQAPHMVVLDLGANAECRPEQFLQFAAVGVAYIRCLLGIANPTVGLVSNGTEPAKGTTQTRAAYGLLKQSGLNFMGYIEGWDLAHGRVNVALCDGIVGNVLLKYTEGLGGVLGEWVAQRLEGQLARPSIDELVSSLRSMMEVGERLGGEPLLGVDGVMVVGHGRSRAPAVARAIAEACWAVKSGLIHALREELTRVEALICDSPSRLTN